MIRLIVGLGNPGKPYQKTRHNVGAWLVERLCRTYQVVLKQKSSLWGQWANLPLSESLNVHLCIPTTFMNQSGCAVNAIMNYYKIAPKQILIIHDELDFPPGIAHFKFGGGGGHNGLRDILAVIKDNGFWRLRIGIGHPGTKLEVPRYVLNTPTAIEYQCIQKAIQNSIAVLKDFCAGHAEQAIQILHTPKGDEYSP